MFRDALEYILRHGSISSRPLPLSDHTWGLEHAVSRLSAALGDSTFSLDHAVLLRQCLRMLPTSDPLVVEGLPEGVSQLLSKVGVTRQLDGVLYATPFSPSWLDEFPAPEVDAPARAPVVDDATVPGEGWLLRRLGKPNWKSSAQREATWRALCAPPNSTQLFGLPTGAGKSLVYQACAALEPGLTVLIVPTVALGIDQLQAVSGMPFAADTNPQLYASGIDTAEVMSAIEDRTCRLLITSPEACLAGRLRPILTRLAEEGWLRRIVVDEAHIIESWGASFRIEFQLLGSLVCSWRRIAPHGIHVILLSATFTPSTPAALRTLFSDHETPWEALIVQRLRPEIRYFAPRGFVDSDLQVRAVMEALLALPRPLILYVTEKKEAARWAQLLSVTGFVRFACFHGDTTGRVREEIMRRWRADEFDIVVATSAFGMGVDKADVRAIIHACYPENIDRFYQEVGRGGRDGAPAISLTIATARDYRIGSRMGPTLLTDKDKVNGRWQALWASCKATEAEGTFRVLLSSQPNYRLGQRSYEENVRWNKRLLMMMERGGLLRVVGMEWEHDEANDERLEWALIQPLRSTVELDVNLAQMLEGPRDAELATVHKSRAALDELLKRVRSPCRALRLHYGAQTRRACGSCSRCRSGSEAPVVAADLLYEYPGVSSRPAVDVVEGPTLRASSGYNQVVLALRRLLRSGPARRFVVGYENLGLAQELLARADDADRVVYRLDVAGQEVLASIHLTETVIFLHFDKLDPDAWLFHGRGARCAHWMLGCLVESTPGRWPFLYESESRAYTGSDAINDWISNQSAPPRGAIGSK